MALRSMLTQFYPPKPAFTEDDVVDQTGRIFLVTGGSHGIGFELCNMLYRSGATVYLSSRSKDRAEAAIQTILTANPISRASERLRFLHIDLNDLESVKAAASQFNSLESKLDAIVHNAGSSPYDSKAQSKTAQGLEPMVGMHCVAPLLLTKLLLPKLRVAVAGSPAGAVRIVWTASISAEFSSPANGIDFSKLETGTADNVRNYGVSKLGNWALAKEAARRFGSEGIVSVVVNPGNVKAGTYEGLPTLTHFLMKWLVLSETKMGAYTELYACLAAEVGKKEWNGSYILPFGRLREDEKSHRADIIHALKQEDQGGLGYARKFWDWCEEKIEQQV